jgi:regulatory protein YycH of two-component signal transduction system YycFG
MRKILFLLLGVSLFLSSCLTVYEKFEINKDGSGTMEYLIDLNNLYNMLESFGGDSAMSNGMGISESFDELIPSLSATEGISDLVLTGEPTKYIFGIKFKFANESSLNMAMALLMDEHDNSNKYVSISKRKFIRYHKTSEEFSLSNIFGDEKEGIDSTMVAGMLTEMKYNISVTFPKKIKKVSTKSDFEITDDKTIEIKTDFLRMLENNKVLETTILTK